MLPSPLPDDPRKWDGWSRYDSEDYYERLCLTLESRPGNELIEEQSRQLLVWWQKKLPLKNQPSNPIAQLLRSGIDAAPRYIAEARHELLSPERRAKIDAILWERRRQSALTEFQKFLDFALAEKLLTPDGENNLLRTGRSLGLGDEDVLATINAALERTGSKREAGLPPPAPAPLPVVTPSVPRTRRLGAVKATPADDFRRMLRISGLDEDSMSDDRRDTFIDMAENLGLDAGEAEDMVDEYLEAITDGQIAVVRPPSASDAPLPPVKPKAPVSTPVVRPVPAGGAGHAANRSAPVAQPAQPSAPQLSSAEERQRYADFATTIGARMLLIPSATFLMGSAAANDPANEHPQSRVTLTRYYISRHPITNAQYEKFAPAHTNRRMPLAGDNYPAVYVSSLEAIKFCQWLSARERKKYRLPTEAEWEYAAKGDRGRTFPWGEATGQGTLANFADVNTSFPWRDPVVNDGYAETSPVGSYPSGASPFGIEDMAGNVWEWCLDFYEAYKGNDRLNPRGPTSGAQRVYRGGSWKSRFASLRTTVRGYNQPTYASNDVGFRIVCECD